ncbi:MAG: hypothetical protein IJO52_01635 [Clostridia bacterium]|nr:hypothetical protein [Clostridia bacterium]
MTGVNMQCESCMYYDYTDESDEKECTVSLDEDEMLRLASDRKFACPYYKYFDEYKMVRKQN